MCGYVHVCGHAHPNTLSCTLRWLETISILTFLRNELELKGGNLEVSMIIVFYRTVRATKLSASGDEEALRGSLGYTFSLQGVMTSMKHSKWIVWMLL